jgi:membrane protein required for colicin V production
MLDIIFVVLLVLGAIKGYQRGLIVGVFSFVSIIIGLAAAMKLSAVAATYLGDNVNVSGEWMPVISFAIVFIIVVLLVRWGANVIQRTVEISMLGWVNRLGGVILYVALFVTVFSVLLFYADQVHLINESAKEKSLTYHVVQPWGPHAINAFGSILPVFKNMFTDLQGFFGTIS